MNKKGLDALSMIFTLFILIVVTLVVVKLFIQRVRIDEIQPIDDVTQTYNYNAALSQCTEICNDYLMDASSINAARFCEAEIDVDIDGNKKTSEEGAYGLWLGVPRCEDGLYCFDIYECGTGTNVLDKFTCKDELFDYYYDTSGYTEDVAKSIVASRIDYGTCEPDVTKSEWQKIEDFEAVTVPAYNSDWRTGITKLGPDYWWVVAGYYGEIYSDVVSSQTILSCQQSGTSIICSWSNCEYSEMNTIFLSDFDFGFLGGTYDDLDESGSYVFSSSSLKAGDDYIVTLMCNEYPTIISGIYG